MIRYLLQSIQTGQLAPFHVPLAHDSN